MSVILDCDQRTRVVLSNQRSHSILMHYNCSQEEAIVEHIQTFNGKRCLFHSPLSSSLTTCLRPPEVTLEPVVVTQLREMSPSTGSIDWLYTDCLATNFRRSLSEMYFMLLLLGMIVSSRLDQFSLRWCSLNFVFDISLGPFGWFLL